MRALLAAWALAIAPAAVLAEPVDALREETADRPDGIHVLDGSYVLNVGRMQVNITNHGLIGSQYSTTLPFANAPSAQWPGGTGDEYLFGAGLWIGARVDGEQVVSTGQPERELRPDEDLRATIYEARGRTVMRPYPDDRPRGNRPPDAAPDDDGDGRIDEDPLNGYDDDGDGLVDEDFGQIGDQMMVCTMRDDTPLSREAYPSHAPIGVQVVQRAAAWEGDGYDDIVALDFEITNVSAQPLHDVYIGFYADCDIQNRSRPGTLPDDLTGYYDGFMRAEDSTFHHIQVGWMKDAAEDPLPGVFGVVFLDHDTDFMGVRAPHIARVRSYQSFATNASSIQDGEPVSDDARYAAMAATRNDPDAREDHRGDYKFLISSGPFNDVEPGKTLHYRVALVIGDGMEGMLAAALQASKLQRGRWFNLDGSYQTGQLGAETYVCLGDYPPTDQGIDPLFERRYAAMDEACTGRDPIFGYEIITREHLTETLDGRWCMWVNADNCEECMRAVGQECTVENGLYFRMNAYPGARYATTGVGGREGRLAWIYGGETPPVSPGMRVQPGDHWVDIFWDDSSQHDPDYKLGLIDFESYRLWRVVNWTRPQGVGSDVAPTEDDWRRLREWDVDSMVPRNLSLSRRNEPLGMNTGFDEIVYRPRCLDDPRYAGLDTVMQAFVDADPLDTIRRLPPLRLPDGTPRSGYEVLLPWEWAGDVLDTFFAVTPRAEDEAAGIVGKRAMGFYTYRDREVHNEFLTYYAVTATDHALADTSHYGWWEWGPPLYAPSGPGVGGEPASNYVSTRPRVEAQTASERATMGANIYLYPNPVTREALDVFDAQFPTADNPTGRQVVFANLPAAHNKIRIYTAAGDFIVELEHDGTGGNGGSTAWDMMSRNGQEITSGIYFFVVKSDLPGFEDVVGRFIVVW